MIPNFEPQVILPRLAALLRPADYLLFSANLAPGADYAAGVQRILPLYDNALTRDWLMTFLLDLGVETADGELRFVIEDDPGWQRPQTRGGLFPVRSARGKSRWMTQRFEFPPARRFACSSPTATRPRSCARCSAARPASARPMDHEVRQEVKAFSRSTGSPRGLVARRTL